MPRAGLLVGLLACLSGCLSGCDGLRSLFDPAPTAAPGLGVPVTLSALRALARQGDAVTVRRQARTGFDFRCGHSELCLVVLPIAVVAAVVPPLFDDATLTRHGMLIFQGIYDLRGRLVAGAWREHGVQRDVRRLPLRELGEAPVVEVFRAPVLSDGGLGVVTPTALTGQIDLVPRYRRRMREEPSPLSRARLLTEALRWVGAPALVLVHERITAHDDGALAETVSRVCGDVPNTPVEVATGFIDAVVSQPSPNAAFALSRWCGQVSPTVRARLAGYFSGLFCNNSEDLAVRVIRDVGVSAASPRCASSRGAIADALAGRPVDETVLRRALGAQGVELRQTVLARLDPGRWHGLLLSLPDSPNEVTLMALASTELVPSAVEATEILRRWTSAPRGSLARVAALDLLARPGVRAVFQPPAQPTPSPSPDPDSLALRAVLGDRSANSLARRAAPAGRTVWMTGNGGPNVDVDTPRALVALALWAIGCGEVNLDGGETLTCDGPRPWPRPEALRSLWRSLAQQHRERAPAR